MNKTKCEFCGRLTDQYRESKNRKKRFCSIVCSNRSKADLLSGKKRTLSVDALNRIKTGTNNGREKYITRCATERNTISFELLSKPRRRARLIEDCGGRCFKCKHSIWMGEKLSLEMHHIDGDNTNNAKDNCVMLCPNCHSITKFWRNKGIKIVNTKDTQKRYSQALRDSNMDIKKAIDILGLKNITSTYRRVALVRAKMLE